MGYAYAVFGIALILPFFLICTYQCFIESEDYKSVIRKLRCLLSAIVSPLTFYLVWQEVQKLIVGYAAKYILSDAGGMVVDSVSNLINFISGFVTFTVLFFIFATAYKFIINADRKIAYFVYASFLLILLSTKYLMRYDVGIGVTILTCVVLPTMLYSLFYCIMDSKLCNMVKNISVTQLSGINLIPLVAVAIVYICSFFTESVMAIVVGDGNTTFSALSFVIGLLLLLLVFMSYDMIFANLNKTAQVIALTKGVQEAQENVIVAFAEIIETKSGQTGKHIHRVAEYSRVLARALKLPEEDVETLRVAAMMHDVGKLMIPPAILEKERRLTDEEYEIMKKHVVYGESILHNAPGKIMEFARTVALEHHERWDGKGYLGMVANNIHRISRIVAVADVFDALVSDRSYKVGWSLERAKALIVDGSGSQFDPAVVDAFVKNFDKIIDVYDAFPEIASEDDVNHRMLEDTVAISETIRR